MHPLLAAGFANSVAAERADAARRRAVRRGADTSGQTAPQDPAQVVIRRATAADAPALVRLGALDGDRRAGERLAHVADTVLVAEVDGTLEAALAVDGGLAIADPFRPSALHAQLLAVRARQLGGDAPHRSHGRLGVLHLRTS
jgi:hypothetical protein